MTLPIRIHQVIRARRGADQAITTQEICRTLGLPLRSEREIRRQIEEHSPRWPELVCAIPGRGYFVATEFEEAERYDNWLSQLVNRALCKRKTFRAAAARLGLRVPSEKAA